MGTKNNTIDRSAIVEEVSSAQKAYITDGYSMSIGELVSLYTEGEIDINPDFQRKYRWSNTQRTRLIESILIGVPLPSIFVYQTERGIWEVVDGVQRLSTIFQFMGKLKDADGRQVQPLELEATKMLPSFANMTWEKMPKEPLQLDFRRTKIKIEIIKNTTHPNAKFEVFQRLNYSTILSGQEFRNAVLIMMDKKIYEWLKDLAESSDYRECLDLTERWLDESYHYELVLRLFLFARYADRPIYKVDDFINEYFIYDDNNALLRKIQQGEFDLSIEKEKFLKTFSLLKQAGGLEVFKKGGRGTQFLESYFESIAIGLYINIGIYEETKEYIEIIQKKIKEIKSNIPSAKNTSSRIPITTKFGKDTFWER